MSDGLIIGWPVTPAIPAVTHPDTLHGHGVSEIARARKYDRGPVKTAQVWRCAYRVYCDCGWSCCVLVPDDGSDLDRLAAYYGALAVQRHAPGTIPGDVPRRPVASIGN
jgi:hypothetical protein